MFAEISDKMPALHEVWTMWGCVGLFTAVVAASLSAIRSWMGAVIVCLCVGLGLFLAAPDPVMDEAILRELGAGYLLQQRMSVFLPGALSAAAWVSLWLVRRPKPYASVEPLKAAK